MPRTRPELNRDEKVGEILEAAERRSKEASASSLSSRSPAIWVWLKRDQLAVTAPGSASSP